MSIRKVLVRGGCALSLLAGSLLCGCDADGAQPGSVGDGPVGAVSVDLQRDHGIDIEQLRYTVTRDGTELRSGMMTGTGDRNVIDRLPVGPIAILLQGVARNGLSCSARATTTVVRGRTIALAIWLQCVLHGGAKAGAGGSAACAGQGGSAGSAGGAGVGGHGGHDGNGNGDGNGDGDGDDMDGGVIADGGAGEDAGGGAGEGGAAAGAGGSAGADAGGAGAGGSAGADAGTDAGGEPSICDAPADDCDECACASCADELDACEHAPGLAQAGPAAGTSLATLCMDFVRCAQSSGCSGLLCFCGPGVDLATCLGGGAFGACRDEMIGAAETTVPTTVVSRQADDTFAIGRATDLIGCTLGECAASCQ